MLRFGILGASDIAYRMFVPAISTCPDVICVAVAANVYDGEERKRRFTQDYDIPVMDEPDSFMHLISREDIDVIYVPQPPALHYEWAKQAFINGKHVFLEKPSTTCSAHTEELVKLAESKGLVLHENYMFQYHAQLAELRRIISDGIIGEVRLYRAMFSFPLRAQNDFRYNRKLGGGALLDCGGYVVKLATLLLGSQMQVKSAVLTHLPGYEVDMLGSVHLSSPDGQAFQGAFGMDCHYQCSLEVLGSSGKLTAGRIFTAPSGLVPPLTLESSGEKKELTLPSDNHFLRSLTTFIDATCDDNKRRKLAEEMLIQAKLIDEIRQCSGEESYI